MLLNLVKNLRKILNSKPIENFYNSNFKRKMLLCYITEPFKNKSYSHTNYIEANNIAKVFNDLGYVVDVIDYDYQFNQKFIEKTSYDLIFGFGDSYNNAILSKKNLKATKIIFATGAHNSFQNNAELNRIHYLYQMLYC